MSPREPLVLLPLEITQVIRPLILAHVRVMRGLGSARACAGPHQFAIVVVDVGARVDVAVGGEEDVAWGDEFGAQDFKVYYWGVEVWSLLGMGQ